MGFCAIGGSKYVHWAGISLLKIKFLLSSFFRIQPSFSSIFSSSAKNNCIITKRASGFDIIPILSSYFWHFGACCQAPAFSGISTSGEVRNSFWILPLEKDGEKKRFAFGK